MTLSHMPQAMPNRGEFSVAPSIETAADLSSREGRRRLPFGGDRTEDDSVLAGSHFAASKPVAILPGWCHRWRSAQRASHSIPNSLGDAGSDYGANASKRGNRPAWMAARRDGPHSVLECRIRGLARV